MKILAVIPARYDSQRLAGKVLALIGNKPMVQWVYEAAINSNVFTKVVVATDSQLVVDRVIDFGGEVELTSSDHSTGTDRVAEVATRYPEFSVVVNVQGDQPFVTSKMLQELVTPYLEGESPEMTTLACPLNQDTGYHDPNVVKVLCGQKQQALYFSRSPIPFYRNPIAVPVFHHLGLYAFRQDFLGTYTQLSPTPIEQCEGLEQLRVLEHGYTIRVCQTAKGVVEVNTAEDLIQAQNLVLETA
jgi:3-deoxy-manno-octulosonate cytidylyltransferase (CMP-KDO synthetase)